MADWTGGSGGGSAKKAKTPVANDPQKALLRLATRLNRAKPAKGVAPIVTGALKRELMGYSSKQLRKLGKDAKLSGQDVRALETIAAEGKASREGLGVSPVALATAPLKVLDLPSQAVKGGLAEGPGGALRGLTGKEQYRAIPSVLRAIGKSEAEANRIEARLPGYIRGPVSFAGDVAFDPTTYLTVGASGVAKAAAQSAAERAGTGTARQVLTQGGKKALGREAYQSLPKALRKQIRHPKDTVRFAGIPIAPARLGSKSGAAKAGTRLGGLEREFRTLPGLRQGVRSGEFTPDVVSRVEALTRKAGAARSLSEQDLARVLPAAKKIKGDDAFLRVTRALDNPDNLATLDKNERALFDVLDSLRREGTTAQLDVGLPAALREGVERYFPRVKPVEPSKPGVARPTNLSKTLSTNLRARSENLRNIPVEEADRIVRAGGREGFELNPAIAVLRRKALANRDVAKVEWVKGLREISNAEGVPLLQTVEDFGDEVAKELDGMRVGMTYRGNVVKEVPVTVADEAGGLATQNARVLVHPALAHDPAFDRVIKVFSDPQGAEEVRRWLDKGMGLWKSYATTFGPFTGGFATRNFIGNLINGYWLTGTSPIWNVRAGKLIRQLHKGIEAGDPYKFLKAADRTSIGDALHNGVIGTGFYSADLGAGHALEGLRDLGGASRLRRFGRAVNPVNTDNALLRVGRNANSFVEDSSRLGLFLAKRKGGFTNENAAGVVDKYLFNYGDLSKMDEQIKRVIPFWTWTRKNLPLQLEAIAKQPGKITTPLHALGGIQAGLGGPDDPLAVQQWMKDAGAITTGGTAIMPDLPSSSAAETLAPLGTAAKIATTRGPDDWQKLFRDISVALQPGGPLGGAASGAFQVGVGRELFTGREFQEGENRLRIPGQLEFFLEQAAPIGPALAKIRGLAEAGNRGTGRRALGGLTGLQLYPINERTRTSESYRRLGELQRMQRWLASKGIAVDLLPTGSSAKKGGAQWTGG